MQARRLGKRDTGNQIASDDLNVDPLGAGYTIVSSSSTNGASLFED